MTDLRAMQDAVNAMARRFAEVTPSVYAPRPKWHVKRHHGAWWIYQPDETFWDYDVDELRFVLDRVRGLARMAASFRASEGGDFSTQVDEWAKGNHARWSE